ncbi:DEAD/DEAH box helicase family protein [Halodesulfovibrio sp. MK-HDV]|jgi:type III restriction/modification enzyme restriction subunit/helicase-like protein|uniref:DEAD/DEAH box helicase family protein n=1 Tax=Halodesulfovibrio sp. MK-HDV TaxID=2599925 RepID=UPI001371EDAD|nr:DEAD/DEAH box helicase family protein [Halodesulfovibrio sp. MK-HDV]KAF1075458.1 hypothetical protein MKHDV_01906 [Halodesulfovibrio sp. MK-HDV]
MSKLTLRSLKHKSFKNKYVEFLDVYSQLFSNEELNLANREKILSIIALFSNVEDQHLRQIGYRMALEYSNKTQDFTPLYDLSINLGLYPVTNQLRTLEDFMSMEAGLFLPTVVDGFIENYRRKGVVFTEQQNRLNNFFDSNIRNTAIIVAPTSYGKSELIVSGIKQSRGSRVCIVVPSKALLAQTRKRILDEKIDWVKRIVSHPEMHRVDDYESVYVLTQERLSRILTADKKMAFDLVFVDEAHNMLAAGDREILLTSTIKILSYRNSDTAFKFLTPFLQEPSSLSFKDSNFESLNYKISEYVKSEKIFVADYRAFEKSFSYYDHFFNHFFEHDNDAENYLEHVIDYSKNKNIVYLNKPKDAQDFARRLAKNLPKINSSTAEKAISEIGEAMHKKYLLLRCLKKGVLYHHGSMPEAVRNYVEYLYTSCDDIKYLVSTSTLLEGVNLPIERMFLLDIRKGIRKMSPSQFKNLIGRVNRFGDIFRSNEIKAIEKLQPQIHVVGSDQYGRVKANLNSFVTEVMHVTKTIKDEPENILLDPVQITDDNRDEFERVMTRLENMEEGISGNPDLPRVCTDAGLKLLENNISELDPLDCENAIQSALDNISDEFGLIDNSRLLMRAIYQAFIAHLETDQSKNRNLVRLKAEEAQMFYAMFLDWKIRRYSYARMIRQMIDYWNQLPPTALVFVGKWGDTTQPEGYLEHFTRIGSSSFVEKVNFAIVRIKEEEDFLEHDLFRFVEILNELEMLDEDFYLLAKYGTNDPKVISLIRNGFSRTFAEMLLTEYSNYFQILDDDQLSFNPELHNKLEEDGVGYIHRQEVLLNVAEEN